jgi:6-phosphofructokinase 1
MVAVHPPDVDFVPLPSALTKMRTVPLDCDTIRSGRDLGVSFGDEGPDE